MSEESHLLPTPNSTEWLENYYQQQILDNSEVPFGWTSNNSISDDTSFGDDLFPGSEDTFFGHNDTTGANITSVPVINPGNSSPGSNDLSPKATIAKQPRPRRSRASRKTPATLLHASIKDFRALVQEYTGCHSATSTSGFNKGKGPITLSFGSSIEKNDYPGETFVTPLSRGHYYTEQAQFQERQ